ncbi:hypothetical protein BDF21DRAFT_456040 [Thamnidium elegans]|nr:hypothetical protein BDF21DRAFT_456040 [Thamnidium elegans]
MQFTQETLIHKRYKRARTNASYAKIENRLDEILRGDTPLDTVPAVTTELSNNDQIYLEENGLNTTEWTRLENDDDFDNIDFSFEDDEIVSDREEEEDILSDRETTDPTVNSNSKYIERDIYVPSYPFSPIQEYSVRLMNICEETNICREGHRLLSRLINEIIADTSLELRSKQSLLLKDKTPLYIDNDYGIRSPSIFGSLVSFISVAFHPIDEMHMYSNIAKDVFSMMSPKYNSHFKYCGNETEYPFQLSNSSFEAIKKSMESSRSLIPASCFKGSWLAIDQSNVKQLYRSSEWLDYLLYCVPTLIISQFKDLRVITGFLSLIRGISLSLQFRITQKDLEEIDRCFEIWFEYIDSLIAQKRISNCIYKVNMHQLCHITYTIRQCSILRCVSVRSMEREIGAYKKKLRSRINVGENANNIMERTALYSFLKNTKMLDFNPNEPKSDSANTFIYHPSKNKDYGQLWAPFYKPFELVDTNDSTIIGDGLVTMKKLVNALKSYKKRFFSMNEPITSITINIQTIVPSGKLWQDSRVFTSAIFKKTLSKNTIRRGGEHVLFHSTHKIRSGRTLKRVTHWYVGRVLFFFQYAFKGDGSFYALLEIMKTHSVAAHSSCIPVVIPFKETETKKMVVVDIADIITVVGLLKMVHQVTNGRNVTFKESDSLFVISPSTAFDVDMKTTAGSIINLC